jgi:hypothetical protein
MGEIDEETIDEIDEAMDTGKEVGEEEHGQTKSPKPIKPKKLSRI